MASDSQSFLGLEGCHVFITGAAGGIGGAAVKQFLANGCRVTAFDRCPLKAEDTRSTNSVFMVNGDLTQEASLASAFEAAAAHFGPPQILIANAGITDESTHPPIWDLDIEKWDKVNQTNVRGTFLTIKHFLLCVKTHQEQTGQELDNISIVLTGSETGVFGQEGHSEYASGKAGLQYGLIKTVKNEIVRLNSHARVNAVAPGWVDTPLIGDRLDDPREMWAECQATVALKKIAQPSDVAYCMAFLASHRAAGHITGQCISVDGGQEGRLLWKEHQILGQSEKPSTAIPEALATSIPPSLKPVAPKRRMRIALSVDFDALSGYLGTGHTPENTMADYSAGMLSANVGVDRLLRLFKKHGISEKVTWFIPGHSIETFPAQAKAIAESGAEIGLHGYSHEGAYAMSPEQEADVLSKCLKLTKELLMKFEGQKRARPYGYRAPLYQIRESTVKLLQKNGFLYDSSMNAHDALPYFLPDPFPGTPPHVPDYCKPASSWMVPTPVPQQPAPGTKEAEAAMVEIPCSWYTEDMTPLGFYPYTASSQGYVSVDVVENMWWDRFNWLWNEESFVDEGPGQGYGSIFPVVWHPESAGRVHIVGMIDRFIGRLVERAKKAQPGEITFETMDSVAQSWKDRRPFST